MTFRIILISITIAILVLVGFVLGTAKSIESDLKKYTARPTGGQSKESFSPVGCEAQIDPFPDTLRVPSLYRYFKKKFDGKNYTGSCGPGCVYKCTDPNCPNAKKKKYSAFYQQIKEPKAPPVGANNEMSLFFDDNLNQCVGSGVNGKYYATGNNPYGLEMPNGKQMYSFCAVKRKT